MYKEPKHINEIVAGCKHGDRKAQEQLYTYFFDAMINLCLRFTKSEADAEDILAQAFVRVFKNIHQYDATKGSVYSWVHKIVTNCCLYYLKLKQKTIAITRLDDAEDVNLEPEIIRKISDEAILDLIRNLPPATQAVFNLHAVDGYEHKEIAKLLKISEATSRWHLNEARKKIKNSTVEQRKKYLLSDLKRYEEELSERLKKLSSSNKDLVWEKIEALLDKDDDGGPPLLPPSNTGNNFWMWLFGFLLLFTGLWGAIQFHQKDSLNIKNNTNRSNVNNHSTITPLNVETGKENKPLKSEVKNNLLPGSQYAIALPDTNNKKYPSQHTFENKNNSIVLIKDATTWKLKKEKSANKNIAFTTKRKFKSIITSANPEDETNEPDLHKGIISPDTTEYALSQKTQSKNSSDSVIQKNIPGIKTLPKTTIDSSIAARKNSNKQKKKYYWVAGIAIQQPIRLNYDLIYPSDNNSGVSSITAYLPSVYARIYKKNKWFIQAEFKYAAPQDIQEFIYKVNLQQEAFKDIVTSYTLKKTYNNEASASFHYFITSNWSIGSGIMYSVFSGADIEKDVHQKQYESNDLLLGSINMTDKEDSAFSTLMKNNFYWLLETQYKWKNFSLGFRYDIGLQPYIKYIDPFSGLPAEKTNNSLNIFLRYQLWNSGKDKRKK